MNFLTLGSFTVRQLDGLYSLNDLHTAAGGEAKHEPANFLRLDQTKALSAEISNSADLQNYQPVKTQRGANGGTYVCRELVYAYANWISPAFYLKMIRAFDALQAAPQTTKSRQKEIAGGLTAQQQEALRELVKARAEQIDEPRLRAGATIKLWSCLKSHFHLGEKETYRNIPSTQFTEALSVVSRQALEGLAEQQRHDARFPLLSGPAGTRMLVSLELNGRYNVMPLSPTDCVVDMAELVALDAAMDGWRKLSRRYELDARRVFGQQQ